MASIEQAVQTQIRTIEKKTGKTLAELAEIARASGLSKHTELLAMFKTHYGHGHGDANALVHAIFQSDGARAAASSGLSTDALVDSFYTGPKAALRPIHDLIMSQLAAFGEFEILPKKGYLSLRRKKQFAMLGPATNTRVELGLNARDLAAHPRLLEQPKGSMCNYIIRLTSPAEVDAELFAWLRAAYDSSGE